MPITTLHTDKAPAAIGPYSQGKMLCNLVFLSGQIPLDPVTGAVVGKDIAAQTEQIMRNIAALLEAAGSSFDLVLKTSCYLADMGDFAAFNAVYAKYFLSCPARSCVAVKALPRGVLAEVEVIAAKAQ